MMDTPLDVTLADFGSFHVPGRVVEIRDQPIETLRLTETIADFAYDPNGRYAIEGAYVQYMIPSARRGAPVLLVHGGGMNGTVWENTPDGRRGWQHLLLAAGHPVYVIDMVERGRAGFCALDGVWESTPLMRSIEDAWVTFRIGTRTGDVLVAHDGQRFPIEFFAQGAYAWCPRWPGTELAAAQALDKAIRRIGACHVIAHSSGSGAAFQVLSGLSRDDIHSLCLVEPAGLPDVPRIPEVPLLSVWADYVEQSPLWTSLRDKSRAAGTRLSASYSEVSLTEFGLRGHSHLPMQDLGNEAVLAVILDRHIRPADVTCHRRDRPRAT